MAVRMTPPMPRDNSHPGEPIVSAVFPKPPGKAVGHEYRRDPLRILEPELGRNAQLERIAVARRQDLVGNLEGAGKMPLQGAGKPVLVVKIHGTLVTAAEG